jgi:hypothetical protein
VELSPHPHGFSVPRPWPEPASQLVFEQQVLAPQEPELDTVLSVPQEPEPHAVLDLLQLNQPLGSQRPPPLGLEAKA